MPISLLGMSHQTTPVNLREKLYIQEDTLPQTMQALRAHSTLIQECVIISTCNRLEIYGVGDHRAHVDAVLMDFLSQHYGLSSEILYRYCYVRHDLQAVEHVMRVATGLESLVLGEDQILGQVTTSGRLAMAAKTSGAILNRLFSYASHVGKRARTETSINRHTTSVSHAAAHLIAQHFGDVSNLRVLLLGAGEMAELAARAMSMQGFQHLTIANRTFARAEELAKKVNGEAIVWPSIYEKMAEVDVVLAATGAPHTILHAVDMQPILERRNGGPGLVMVDVAVPRNIEAAIDDLDKVRVFDIDALQRVLDRNMAERQASVPQVEWIVAQEREHFARWWQQRAVVPVISEMRSKVREVADSELQLALSRLSHLDEYEQAVVKKLVHRIVNKVLHQPTASLREHADEGDAALFADVVSEIFALNDHMPDHAPTSEHLLDYQPEPELQGAHSDA